MKNFYIILVRPQLGQNIGAVARAMKNFGFTQLRLVAPRDGWPNEKANEMSAGAIDIINEATIFPTLEEASSDLNCLLGLTARDRFLNKEVISPSNFIEENFTAHNHKIGLVFGPENNGLSNQDISLIDKIVTIPTHPDYSSLNIAQSVIIVLYELFKLNIDIDNPSKAEFEPATGKEVADFFGHLESELLARKFFRTIEKKEGMVNNIRSIFKRISNISIQDVRTIRGIVKNLTKSRDS